MVGIDVRTCVRVLLMRVMFIADWQVAEREYG